MISKLTSHGPSLFKSRIVRWDMSISIMYIVGRYMAWWRFRREKYKIKSDRCSQMWADWGLMAAGCTGGHEEALPLSPHPQSKTDQWDLIQETKNKPLPLAQGSRFPWATCGGSQGFLCWLRQWPLGMGNFTWDGKSQNETRIQKTWSWSQWFLPFLITCGKGKGSFRSWHPPQRHQNICIWSPQMDFYLWGHIQTQQPGQKFTNPATHHHPCLTCAREMVFPTSPQRLKLCQEDRRRWERRNS